MPVLRYILPEPTDIVLQGEQLRMSVTDREPELIGNTLQGQGCFVNDWFGNVQDEDAFTPMNSFVCTSRLSVGRSKGGELQVRANAGIATPCGAWVWNDWSPLVRRLTFAPDLFAISGTSRDSTGAPLAGCEVRVFDGSNTFLGQTISDGSGNWSMQVPTNSGPFWARYYLAGAPNRGGTTDYFLVP